MWAWVEHIIIPGYTRCGGIRALLEGQEDKFISSWMSTVDQACVQALNWEDCQTFDEKTYACELAAIEISLSNLLIFPWIQERVEQK